MRAAAGRGGPVPSRTVADAERAAAEDEALLGMRLLGFEPAGEAERLEILARERLARSRRIAAGDCAVFGVLGSPEAGALDLRLRRADDLIAADLSGRPAAWVAHCAEEDVDVLLELDARRVDPSPAPLPATLLEFRAPRAAVRRWAGPPLRPASGARDPAAERALLRGLESAGYSPARVAFEMDDAGGVPHRVEIELAAGECGMLAAHAGPGAGAVALEALPPGSARLGAAGGEEPALLPVCATEAGTMPVDLTVAGGGLARLAFHPLPRVPLPEALVDPPLAIREAAAIFARHGMTLSPATPRPTRTAGGWSARFAAEPGWCYGIAAARRDAIPVESLSVADPAGGEPGRWTGPASPALVARCVHGAPVDLVLEIREPDPGEAGREPPVVVVFETEARAAAPLVPAR